MASTSAPIPIETESALAVQGASGATVRSNSLQLLRRSWQSISRASKFMLLASVFFTASQIAVTVAILTLFPTQTCDKPVQTYLIVYAVRLGLVLPLVVFQHLTGGALRQQRQQQQQQQQQHAAARSTPGTSRIDPGSTTSSSSSSSTFYQPSPSSDAHTAGSSAQLRDQQPAQPSNPPPSNQISSQQQSLKEWCDRIRSLVDLFGILWFIVGNYILFTTQNCTFQARPYYYTILTWVLLNYIVILIPVFVCASVVFCLPCVLVVLRMLNVHDVPGMTVGATNEEIENMPVYRYKKEEADATPTENRSTVTLSAPNKRQSWFRAFHLRLHRQKRTDVESRAYSSITITPQEDAMCSICLSEYEAGDLICKLWCSHHFHKDCVHEWLGLNPLCPLCKQDFRGKEGQDEETEMETR